VIPRRVSLPYRVSCCVGSLGGGPKPVSIPKPGCTAADESLMVLGYLNGLAQGKGGFGVLGPGLDRLELAAEAARLSGAPGVARALEGIAGELPGVRTPAAAAALAEKLEPVVGETWELGRRCGAPQHRVESLARRVLAGKLTREQAIEELKL